ncbi:MAG: hypothetical protein Q9223_006199, partial [Gallowayella weberi]
MSLVLMMGFCLTQQTCQNSTNFGGCGSLTNQDCLCGNATAEKPLGDCEDATCSSSDRL